MAKKKKAAPAKKGKQNDDSTLFAFLATFLSILGFIIALLAKRDDKYVMFYAKQSLIVFIAAIIVGVLSFIPVVGWILNVLWIVLWIFSWAYALSGSEKEVPLLGQFGSKFNL